MIAVWRPARIVDEAADPAPWTRAVAPAVAQQPEQFVVGNDELIKRPERVHDPIDRLVIIEFGNERSEHPVPDDEDAGEVRIEIARVSGVVDAVMARRVHDRLEPFRHLPDRLGVYPVLVDKVYAGRECDGGGVEAEQHQRGRDDNEAG